MFHSPISDTLKCADSILGNVHSASRYRGTYPSKTGQEAETKRSVQRRWYVKYYTLFYQYTALVRDF